MKPTPPPAAGPLVPLDDAPLALDKTPAFGIPDIPLMKRKIDEAEKRVMHKLAQAGKAPAFVPGRSAPFWVAVFVGTMNACGPVLLIETISLRVVLASALMGAASSMAAYFGMRSAGVQKR